MTEIEALINLLQDEDPQIAVVAMEKLLTNPVFVKNHLKELQESPDPCLRTRVHQMESIITRKNQLDDFTKRVKENKIELWEDLIFLNKIIERTLTTDSITEAFKELKDKIPRKQMTTLEIAAFMREESFSCPSDDILDPSLFLIYEVLTCSLGNPLLLCVIARQLAMVHQKRLTIVLHKGRHCLVSDESSFIDPQNGWSVTKLKQNAKVYPCTNRDILLTVISQLYLSALIEGQLRIIAFLSKMMAALSDNSVSEFPYPVGKNSKI
ncbi:MAG: hypothetical protein NE328_01615 [Lentisphaeraceae bacterium]|nr:hypothetical protein [Lentisphaeraceae bacterium]